MLKFFLGLFAGALLSFVYVRYDVELPEWMQLPHVLRENIAATAALSDLYDLSRGEDVRRRALEVYFQTQAKKAAQLDADYGHPFFKNLYHKEATRQARILQQAWSAFDVALSKPALRSSFERKYGVSDPLALKQAMLAEQLRKKHKFLASWLKKTYGDVPNDQLFARLKELGQLR